MSTKKIIYVGVDVDDKHFHISGLDLKNGDCIEFKCKSDYGVLRKKLTERFGERYIVHLCYEASYFGYSLCRFLRKSGINCDVIAPSLIPVKSGDRVKTDRLDAIKLAEYYGKDLLTPIYIPDESDEELRDVIRSRCFLVKQRKMLQVHLLSCCKRYNIRYREETGKKAYWTVSHISWLKKRIKILDRPLCKTNLEMLLAQYTTTCESIKEYESTIQQAACVERYKTACEILCAFRGIDTLSAMTIIVELGDIRRFSHPMKLASYIGLDVAEYSSGGKERKSGITKTGNRHLRTTLVESCQMASKPPTLSKRAQRSREGQPQVVIDIADRCMKRLYKKSIRMFYAGKQNNKIKAACAREMIGFIWEALRIAA